ncbi:hypothetical protein ACMA1D_10805 [Streptomyces sp. 796.1]|uniref:hypothetical protein n=1 Tax=Streptomyces sp. 796.1 TaxID=3163029 RepID=UPI0039C917CF
MAYATVTVDTEETDPDLIAEEAAEYGDFPTVCAQCSGWGQGFSLELGDEWEVCEDSETRAAVVRPVNES